MDAEAVLLALLALPCFSAAGVAQEGDRVSRIRLSGQLKLLGSKGADEIILQVEHLDLTLVEEDLELRADAAVLWGDRDLLRLLPTGGGATDPLVVPPQVPPTAGRAPLQELDRTNPIAALREVYAAGHVFFRQGKEEVVFARELYQNLTERRGVVIEADAFGRTEIEKRPVALHVRAQEQRLLGPDSLAAVDAQFSTCSYGHPHWHVQSSAFAATRTEGEADLASTPNKAFGISTLALSGNSLRVDDVPLLPLPGFTADLQAGETLPLKKIRAGHSKKFGGYLQTLWGEGLPDASARLTEALGLSKPLSLGWEMNVDGYARRGAGLGPALNWIAPGLIEGEIGGYWLHDRQDHDFSNDFDVEHADRGRAYFRDRLTPADHWRLDTETSWFSDADFQQEFFEREFKEEKEPESYAHLVRQEETTRLRFLYRDRLNDYQSQVDALPQLSLDQIGEPLWKLPLPDWLERDGAPNWLLLTHAEDASNLRLHPADDLGLASDRVVRADSQLELSTTLPLGPASLRPFAAGEFTGWDRSVTSEGTLGRAAGVAGARSELMFHRDFDAWSPALSLDGLRHVVLLDADYLNVYDVTRDPADLIQIDGIDALDVRELYLLAFRQRFQTHRHDRIENALELDLEQPLYPHSARDNLATAGNRTTGSTAGPLRYDAVVRPGFDARSLRELALFAEGEWDFHASAMDVTNLGFELRPVEEWTTLMSYRVTRGLERVLTGELDWRLDEKWSVALLEQYDLDGGQGLEHRYALRRHGHDFTVEFGFSRDRGDGDTAFTFAIYPSFLRRGRSGRSFASGNGDRPSLSDQQF